MDAKRQRVLIAGGGVAGLALRRALHARGVEALTIEQRVTHLDSGLAINLPGNAIEALGKLGLGEALHELGMPIRRREYRTERDRLLFSVDEDGFWGESARPRAMRRSDLLSLLYCEERSGGELKIAKIDFAREHQDRVEVGLTDGSILTSALLVGADGVHSIVRRSVTADETPGASLLAAASWRFMAPNPGVDCWTVWLGRRGMILLMPVDGGEVYGWAAAADLKAPQDAGALADLFQDFPSAVRSVLDYVIGNPRSIHHSPLEEVRLRRWGGNRIILMGDAAHATAPVWAQGAALALEDALVLADLLSKRSDWNGIADDYEQQRRQRVEHVQAATAKTSKAARLPYVLRCAVLKMTGTKMYGNAYGPLRSI